MELIKSTKEFTIYKKRTGRYGVKNAARKWLNGEEKVKVLLGEGLIKLTAASAKTQEDTEDTAE
ncbi:MAG: hypothetical protein H6622_15190 [Halobacteriovoraceae bacterium]|nr:hypothetical protein [Halobacteriovoraceae bacterium]